MKVPDPKEEFTENLERSALWAGVSMRDAECLTPGEISTAADVEADKQKDFYRMLAWIAYTGASLTAVGVNDPKRFPALEEAFPSLFERKEQQDWWIMKQRVETYAKVKNNA